MRRLPKYVASLLAASALSAVVACGDQIAVSEPVPDTSLLRDAAASFQTDSLAYTLRAGSVGYEGRVGVTLTNRSGRTAYIVNCNGATAVSFEKLVEGRWQAVWEPPIPACLSAPITVPAGETYRTSVYVFSGYPGTNWHPQFAGTEIAGVYRAVWHNVLRSFQPQLPFGEPLPLEARVSNRFALAVPTR